jgi:hypothetical protein
MSEPKLLIKVELVEDNKLKVTFGTKHEALLCNALKRAEFMLMDMMADNFIKEDQGLIQPEYTTIPKDILKQL